MNPHFAISVLASLSVVLFARAAEPTDTTVPAALADSQVSSSYAQWKNGPGTDDRFFPIAIWLQNPANAARYKAAGINVYVGLWRGPTSDQLKQLENAGMRLICGQNRVALENRDNPVIIAWMHGDEPDNAQSLGEGKGYGPPILPEKIIKDYERIRATDPSRPVLLNLGQGVAWDNWIGRGVRRNHPEDYRDYVKGCDIASFDIYPVVHDAPEVAGKLEYVAYGVKRLVDWTGGGKVVWNCIECTRISNTKVKPTHDQVRSEIWMSLIHGSRGLIYFVHQFKPVFREAALLDDAEMLAGVTAINRQIHELAPVLNSPAIPDGVQVRIAQSGSAPVQESSVKPNQGSLPIAWMQKRFGGSTYLFTVNMRNESAKASISLAAVPSDAMVEVLGEGRKLTTRQGGFDDDFKPYAVHLYRLGGPSVR